MPEIYEISNKIKEIEMGRQWRLESGDGRYFPFLAIVLAPIWRQKEGNFF
jgi:hypothetical protein